MAYKFNTILDYLMPYYIFYFVIFHQFILYAKSNCSRIRKCWLTPCESI